MLLNAAIPLIITLKARKYFSLQLLWIAVVMQMCKQFKIQRFECHMHISYSVEMAMKIL